MVGGGTLEEEHVAHYSRSDGVSGDWGSSDGYGGGGRDYSGDSGRAGSGSENSNYGQPRTDLPSIDLQPVNVTAGEGVSVGDAAALGSAAGGAFGFVIGAGLPLGEYAAVVGILFTVGATAGVGAVVGASAIMSVIGGMNYLMDNSDDGVTSNPMGDTWGGS